MRKRFMMAVDEAKKLLRSRADKGILIALIVDTVEPL